MGEVVRRAQDGAVDQGGVSNLLWIDDVGATDHGVADRDALENAALDGHPIEGGVHNARVPDDGLADHGVFDAVIHQDSVLNRFAADRHIEGRVQWKGLPGGSLRGDGEDHGHGHDHGDAEGKEQEGDDDVLVAPELRQLLPGDNPGLLQPQEASSSIRR